MSNLTSSLFSVTEPSQLLTPISILIATAIALAALWQDRRQAKRSHTLDILLARFSGEEMSGHLGVLAKWEREKKRLPKGKEDYHQIKEALNLYEFISAAARQNVLDIELLYQVRGWAMMQTFDFFEPYIKKRRKELENEKIWEHYEWFVEQKVRPRRNS